MDPLSFWIVAGSLGLVIALAAALLAARGARQRRDARALASEEARGTQVARSLHPVIDPDVCIGSLSCLKACPEGDILGIVDGAARLVRADHCIGHGRCAVECPVSAIKLAFGTSARGVDLPEVDEFFESSRAGVHVVGELGGMGLIRNAMTQGLECAERLAAIVPHGAADVVIVGAGPAGIATAVGLKARGVALRLLEQGTVGGAVAHYPRQKVAMTEPVDLPGYGRFGKKLITKEELLATWSRVLARTGVAVEEGVRVQGVEGVDGALVVRTSRGELRAAKVVLAIGRRGTPRKLGVPGESLEKVAYGLIDPEQYEGRRVLVVGGGDSALESAIQLAERSSAEVTLTYRGEAFARCREANRARVERLAADGRVKTLFRSEVREIREREVRLDVAGQEATLANDFVLVHAGGELPLDFLERSGIALRRDHGDEAAAGGAPVRRSAAEAREAAERRRRRAFRLGLVLAGVAIIAFLAWLGRDYYPLARDARKHSPLHAALRPAGRWGHGIGIAATALMLSNFLYAVRKRARRLTGLGSIQGWLDIHVFAGFLGPLVIAFHAAFQSNNLLATGTGVALGVVVGTGIVGRYIYSVVPAAGGKAIELQELLGRFERLRAEAGPLLAEAGDAGRALLERATAPVAAGSLAVLFFRWPIEFLTLRVRLAALRGRFRDAGRFAELGEDLARLARLRWQIRFYAGLRRLLRGWRVIHASLAAFLVVALAAHIGVSLYLGYGLK